MNLRRKKKKRMMNNSRRRKSEIGSFRSIHGPYSAETLQKRGRIYAARSSYFHFIVSHRDRSGRNGHAHGPEFRDGGREKNRNDGEISFFFAHCFLTSRL